MKSIWDHPLCDHEYEKKKIGKSISEDTPHLKSALNDFDQLSRIHWIAIIALGSVQQKVYNNIHVRTRNRTFERRAVKKV